MSGALRAGSLVLTAAAGYGKTTALTKTLGESQQPVAWIGCSATERGPGALAMRIVRAVAAAAPGTSDALAERLAFTQSQIDPLAVVRELIAELSRLLLDPLVLVFDDAEQLDGAAESLHLVDELIRAGLPLLEVAVAGRRALDLRLGKPRASGRLTELTASDFAFDAEECAELLRLRTGSEPPHELVDLTMEVTEGWPLGIAVAAGIVERVADPADRVAALGTLGSASDLRSYLADELFHSLDPELRDAALRSSVVPVVSPAVARALELPDAFADRIERAGMLVRRRGESDGFAYHPLLREFLLERAQPELGEAEWRRLNAAAAAVVAVAGDMLTAIDRWVEGHAWEEAAGAIVQEGPALVRTTPRLLRRWLSLLPEAQRRLPEMLALEGQLDWLSGANADAIAALWAAIEGFRGRPNPPFEWVARTVLVDLLFATGRPDEVGQVIEGWDEPEAVGAFDIAPAAAMFAAVTLAAYARFEDSDRIAAAAGARSASRLLEPLEALRRFFVDLPRGHVAELCALLDEGARGLEPFDPLNIRQLALGARAIALADRGDPDEALQLWLSIRHGAGTSPVLADATHAWAALLHAQAGRLAEAETELARHRALETGARSFIAALAPAAVASLRGDGAGTLAAADAALEIVSSGPILFRYWAGADLVPALAGVGMLARAGEVLASTLASVDAHHPAQAGALPRARLLGLRAWLASLEGDHAVADADLQALWDMPCEALRCVLRREWRRLRPLVWDALERGVLEPGPALDAMAGAFPEGLELVDFLDHPLAAVRRSALEPAVRCGHPEALARLEHFRDDPDAELAGAAARVAGPLAISLPPLRFELLGRFSVRRGSWTASESAWARPMDARLVRFLLVNLGHPVSEDEIFEALWRDVAAKSARASLQVSVSRARRVLDPPGAGSSVIGRSERWYRLALGSGDSVDADDFRRAAGVALGERGEQRRALLERACGLWGGEPLPEDSYADWTTAYREALIDLYTAVLSDLIELQGRAGEHALAAGTARQLVQLDPLNEAGHRALMVAYARAGRPGHALRQYLECRRALVDALGIEPAEATSRLQARILAGEAL